MMYLLHDFISLLFTGNSLHFGCLFSHTFTDNITDEIYPRDGQRTPVDFRTDDSGEGTVEQRP